MDLLKYICQNNELNTLLMRECDIYFYDKIQQVAFSNNHEIYSIPCKAFAQDGSGGEFVFLEDDSIGFISSEGDVGRVAETLEELLIFLLHAGCISDFNCKYLYKNHVLLRSFCAGYLSKTRENYIAKNEDWDKTRSKIAETLSLPFHPDKLDEFAMKFYQSATREPIFSCKYIDGENEYVCDSVLSDIVGLWITELTGMKREEIESYQ